MRILYISVLALFLVNASANGQTDSLPKFATKKADSFSKSASKNKKVLKNRVPYFSPYVASATKPNFSDHEYWRLTDGFFELKTETSAQKNATFGKEYFPSLKNLYKQGKEKEALSKALAVLKVYRANDDKVKEIELLHFLASFCEKYELWDQAENYYKSILRLTLLEPESFDRAEASAGLSNALNKQKKYDEADKYNDFALLEYIQSGNLEGVARCNFIKAERNFNTGDFLAAENLLLTKTLPLYSYVNNQAGRLACFEKLGRIYAALNRNSEAKWFFIQQNILSENIGDKISNFTSLVELGKVKASIADYELALKDFKRANDFLKSYSSTKLSLQLEEGYNFYFQKQGHKKLGKLSRQKCKKYRSTLDKIQQSQRKYALSLLNPSNDKKALYIAVADID